MLRPAPLAGWMFFALVISAPLTWPERSAFRTAVGSSSGLRMTLSNGNAWVFQYVGLRTKVYWLPALVGDGSSLYGPDPTGVVLIAFVPMAFGLSSIPATLPRFATNDGSGADSR